MVSRSARCCWPTSRRRSTSRQSIGFHRPTSARRSIAWRESRGATGRARSLAPINIRVGTKTAKGYHRHQFEEVWQRYPAREGGQGADERSQGNNADEMGTSSAFQKVTAESDVTFQKCEKPPSNGHCYRVTDQNGGVGASGARAPGEGQKCTQCGKDGARAGGLLWRGFGVAAPWGL